MYKKIYITILQKKKDPKILNINKLRKGHDALSIIKLVQEQLSKHYYRQIDYKYAWFLSKTYSVHYIFAIVSCTSL